MALINYTSPNVNNTAASDAIKHFGQIGASGIFKIEGATLTPTASGNVITFSKGYASIQGRFFEMEAGTTYTIPLTGTAIGYVCIKFNWQSEVAELIHIEASGSAPLIRQDNMIASNDGEYNLPIAYYIKTTSNLTLYSTPLSSLLDNAKELKESIAVNYEKIEELEGRLDALGFEEFEIVNLSPETISIRTDPYFLTKIGNRVTGYLSVQTNGFAQTPSGTKIFKIPSKFIPKDKIIRGYISGSSVTLNIADDGTYTTTKLLSVSSGYATVISSYVWWEIDI